jgi:hypothetical protein
MPSLKSSIGVSLAPMSGTVFASRSKSKGFLGENSRKGGKFHEVPAHHSAQEYLDAYVGAGGIDGDRKGALFRSAIGMSGKLSEGLSRQMHLTPFIFRYKCI